MFEIGGLEILIILLVGFVALGPKKLPEAAVAMARLFNRIKRNSTEIQRLLFTELAMEEKRKEEETFEKAEERKHSENNASFKRNTEENR